MKRRVTNQQALDLKTPGRYSIGGNLFLLIRKTPAGTLSRGWTFKFTRNGVTHEMGLGSILRVSPAKARLKAARLRLALDEDKDPFPPKKAPVAAPETFRSCAKAFVEAKGAGWKPKHRAQWLKTIDDYLAPIGKMPISAVDTTAVVQCLEPLWSRIPGSARKTRGMVEQVLDYAAARELRSGANPARWCGHLQNILSSPGNGEQKHHEAMPYDAIPDFIRTLRAQDTMAAKALEFTILTACRSNETRMAAWLEFDLANKIWIIPATKTKNGREHRVPLPDQATRIIESLSARRSGDFVFAGTKAGAPIGKMAMAGLVPKPFTTHGMRSGFRDFAGNETVHAREIAETALGHTVGGVEAVYRRSDALGRRRELMSDWGFFCEHGSKKLVPIRNAG